MEFPPPKEVQPLPAGLPEEEDVLRTAPPSPPADEDDKLAELVKKKMGMKVPIDNLLDEFMLE